MAAATIIVEHIKTPMREVLIKKSILGSVKLNIPRVKKDISRF